jgi:hypothetical protein
VTKKPMDGAKSAYEDAQSVLAQARIAAKKDAAARAMLISLKRLVAEYEEVPDIIYQDGRTIFEDARDAIAAAEAAGITVEG